MEIKEGEKLTGLSLEQLQILFVAGGMVCDPCSDLQLTRK
jgi:hypothetical protein